jgi:hypothetical protein
MPQIVEAVCRDFGVLQDTLKSLREISTVQRCSYSCGENEIVRSLDPTFTVPAKFTFSRLLGLVSLTMPYE